MSLLPSNQVFEFKTVISHRDQVALHEEMNSSSSELNVKNFSFVDRALRFIAGLFLAFIFSLFFLNISNSNGSNFHWNRAMIALPILAVIFGISLLIRWLKRTKFRYSSFINKEHVIRISDVGITSTIDENVSSALWGDIRRYKFGSEILIFSGDGSFHFLPLRSVGRADQVIALREFISRVYRKDENALGASFKSTYFIYKSGLKDILNNISPDIGFSKNVNESFSDFEIINRRNKMRSFLLMLLPVPLIFVRSQIPDGTFFPEVSWVLSFLTVMLPVVGASMLIAYVIRGIFFKVRVFADIGQDGFDINIHEGYSTRTAWTSGHDLEIDKGTVYLKDEGEYVACFPAGSFFYAQDPTKSAELQHLSDQIKIWKQAAK